MVGVLIVAGVPSITSNLTGFANFVNRRVADPEANGLFIIDRRFKGFEEGKMQMANIMYRYTQLTRRQRIQVRQCSLCTDVAYLSVAAQQDGASFSRSLVEFARQALRQGAQRGPEACFWHEHGHPGVLRGGREQQ